MKAVIMAGGSGVRLRPLTQSLPKPMVPLCGRPVMEHILNLLKKYNFRNVAATLGYLPQEIMDYFGDGAAFGVELTYFVEREPLGTAGGVRACAEFLKDSEDFLVISGDGVCDFDLSEAYAFHKKSGADVTMLLKRCESPLEYGLVLTSENGRIEGFLEKPSWGQVFCDTVNTGIYLIREEVLSRIPESGVFDFSKNLFPKMLEDGCALFGFCPEGYWCDIGDAEAYLRSSRDALAGAVSLLIPAPKIKPGVFSASTLPAGVRILPPVYIGSNVKISEGARVGPYTAVGDGSVIERGAAVDRSVIDGARVKMHASVFGAAVMRGAVVGTGAGVSDGAVIGEEAVVGEGSIIFENVRIWPKKKIAPGSKVRLNVITGGGTTTEIFQNGSVKGSFPAEITPEFLLSLGSAAAASEKRCSVFYPCGGASFLAAELLCGGITASGADCYFGTAGSRAAAAFAGKMLKSGTIFYAAASQGELQINLMDESGRTPSRDRLRKIEGFIRRGDTAAEAAGHAGRIITVAGAEHMHAAAAASADLGGLCVFAEGEMLTQTLSLCGAELLKKPRKGVLRLRISEDGGMLTAVSEKGEYADGEHMAAASALCALERGLTAQIEPGEDLPDTVFRMGRQAENHDEAAKREDQPYMADGLFMAVNILQWMKEKKAAFSELLARLPAFSRSRREVPVKTGKASIMKSIISDANHTATRRAEGVSIARQQGVVRVVPLAGQAFRIIAESASAEAAEELCADMERHIKKLDGMPQREI